MGTLTGNQERLPEFCEHKLPTSCRLSSIPTCCACHDRRNHAPSYSTYIDGIGFVSRGTRWQRYCWFCKEFWEKRVEVSGLRAAQTRIPNEPDQTQFLEKWYEFHRGYRIVKKDDGTEERIAVLGEDFKDVNPGCLPRTLEELRAGRRAEEAVQVSQQPIREQEQGGPSLDETFDQMFAEAAAEERQPRVASPAMPLPLSNNIQAQAMNPLPPARNREYQMRRVAALRRELNRMRSGIERVVSGLRDLGENVPDQQEATEAVRRIDAMLDSRGSMDNSQPIVPTDNQGASTTSGPNLSNLQAHVEEARAELAAARSNRQEAVDTLTRANEQLQEAEQRLRRTQHEQRTAENMTRVFGTREEMLAQGENYESPIGGMFTRAYERFRAAEEVRREARTLRQVLEDEERAVEGGDMVAARLAELQSRERDVWGVPFPNPESDGPPFANVQRPISAGLERSLDTSGVGSNALVEALSDSPGTPESPTPLALLATDEEAILWEYYVMLRRQGVQERVPADDSAVVAPIELPVDEHAEPGVVLPRPDGDRETEENEGPPPMLSEDEWWNADVAQILDMLAQNPDLQRETEIDEVEFTHLAAAFHEDRLTASDLTYLDKVLLLDEVIWRSGLPGEWINRRRDILRANPNLGGMFMAGRNAPGISEAYANRCNPFMRLEVTAQGFIKSSELRRMAPELNPPARLQMLYRLQRGERRSDDIEILQRLSCDGVAYSLALQIYDTETTPESEAEAVARAAWIESENARYRWDAETLGFVPIAGHEPDVPDVLPPPPSAFALAASIQAMRTSEERTRTRIQSSYENDANPDPEGQAATQAALDRIASNRFTHTRTFRELQRLRDARHPMPDSPSDSEASSSPRSPSPPRRGLDMPDSSRPEPKTDEELTVSMECKVCYTQLADVACLPCGHLTMCRWCSEQHGRQDPDRPRGIRPTCPVCRKVVKQKVRVYR